MRRASHIAFALTVGVALAACADKPAPSTSVLATPQDPVQIDEPLVETKDKQPETTPEPTPDPTPDPTPVEPDPVDPKPDETDPVREPAPKPTDPAAETGQRGEPKVVDLLPTPEAPHRTRRRMNLDQLNAALLRVSGGIAWTRKVGGKQVNELETLALTLGKPNYTDVTTEDLESSALFQKFLDDAAQSVCKKLATADAKKPKAADRALMRHVSVKDTIASNPQGVDKNLAWLLLRYHGVKVAADSSALNAWRFLFQSATSIAKSPVQGWRAVCVALVVHPRFTTY